MPVAQLVQHALIVIVLAEQPHSLSVDRRRQRRSFFERHYRRRAARAYVIDQIPRPATCRRLHELVVQNEVVRPGKPRARLRHSRRLVAPHLLEPRHDAFDAADRVDVRQHRRSPVRVGRELTRLGNGRHRVVFGRHVRHWERRPQYEVVRLARNPRHRVGGQLDHLVERHRRRRRRLETVGHRRARRHRRRAPSAVWRRARRRRRVRVGPLSLGSERAKRLRPLLAFWQHAHLVQTSDPPFTLATSRHLRVLAATAEKATSASVSQRPTSLPRFVVCRHVRRLAPRAARRCRQPPLLCRLVVPLVVADDLVNRRRHAETVSRRHGTAPAGADLYSLRRTRLSLCARLRDPRCLGRLRYVSCAAVRLRVRRRCFP